MRPIWDAARPEKRPGPQKMESDDTPSFASVFGILAGVVTILVCRMWILSKRREADRSKRSSWSKIAAARGAPPVI